MSIARSFAARALAARGLAARGLGGGSRKGSAQSGFARDEAYVRGGFWRKFERVAMLIPFAPDLIAAYYCAVDRKTPHHVRLVLFAALAYFIMPFDGIPDVMPMLGFADDAAVLAGAIRLVASHITPAHRARAQEAIAKVSRAFAR